MTKYSDDLLPEDITEIVMNLEGYNVEEDIDSDIGETTWSINWSCKIIIMLLRNLDKIYVL